MQHKNVSGELQISINGQKLENVTHATYIGVVVDQHLQWQHQVNHLCKKVSPKLYLLRPSVKFCQKIYCLKSILAAFNHILTMDVQCGVTLQF